MKIAIVVENLNSYTMNLQPWNYCIKTAVYLSKHKHDVIIYTTRTSDENRLLDMEKYGINIVYLKEKRLVFIKRDSIKLINGIKPNVIYWFGNCYSGIFISRNFNPVIININSMLYTLEELKTLSYRELFDHIPQLILSTVIGKYILKRLNRDNIKLIITTTKVLTSRLICNGVNKEKIATAPLVWDPRFPNAHVNNISVQNDTKIVTYFGSSDTIRGTDIILKSAYILKKKRINLKIRMLLRVINKNEKTEKHLVEQVSKKCLTDIVEITSGFLDFKTLNNYLDESDIIVLPFKITLSEPQIAILESLELGKVLITTNTCGIPEMCPPDCAFLIKPGDPTSLADIIEQCISNPYIFDQIKINSKKYIQKLPDSFVLSKWIEDKLGEINE